MVVEGDSVGEAVELQGRVLNGRDGSPSVQSSSALSLLRFARVLVFLVGCGGVGLGVPCGGVWFVF